MTPERTPERAIRAAALRRDLMRRMELGNLDELLVLDQHWQRIELGRDRYGLLDLRQARDWDREEMEEHLDAATYRACERVQRRELEPCEDAKAAFRESCIERSRERGPLGLGWDLSDDGGE